jgi:hypothetical protein
MTIAQDNLEIPCFLKLTAPSILKACLGVSGNQDQQGNISVFVKMCALITTS